MSIPYKFYEPRRAYKLEQEAKKNSWRRFQDRFALFMGWEPFVFLDRLVQQYRPLSIVNAIDLIFRYPQQLRLRSYHRNYFKELREIVCVDPAEGLKRIETELRPRAVESSDAYNYDPVDTLTDLTAGFGNAPMARRLLMMCTVQPVNAGYSVCHSDVMGQLMKYHLSSDIFDHCQNQVLHSHGTRALYGIKCLQYWPVWDEVKNAAYHALLSDWGFVSTEGTLMVQERSNVADLLAFLESKGFTIDPQGRSVTVNFLLDYVRQKILPQLYPKSASGICIATGKQDYPHQPVDKETVEQLKKAVSKALST